jgi:hypothetical protein
MDKGRIKECGREIFGTALSEAGRISEDSRADKDREDRRLGKMRKK